MKTYTLEELVGTDDYRNRHDFFQVPWKTVRSGVTMYGAYRQLLLELVAMTAALANYYDEIEELGAAEESHRRDIRHGGSVRMPPAVSRQVRQRKILQLKVRNREDELAQSYAIACAIREKHFDKLTDEKRRDLVLDYWEKHMLKEAALDWLSTGRVSRSTLDHVFCMPLEMRNKVMPMIQPRVNKTLQANGKRTMDLPQCVDWYQHHVLELPEPSALPSRETIREVVRSGADTAIELVGIGDAEDASTGDALALEPGGLVDS